MFHYIILASALTVLLTALPPSSADPQLIISTCKEIAKSEPLLSGNYQICADFLNSDPRSAGSTLEGLGEISFDLTKTKTVAIESQINSLLEDPKVGPDVKKVLSDCSEMYSLARYLMGKASSALKAGDFSGANKFASSAMYAPSDCEGEFEGGVASPLKQLNVEIGKFYSINLAFTVLLHK